jgi:hypothetical protein
MKTTRRCSFNGTFGLSSQRLGDSGKKSVFCPFDFAQGMLLSSVFCALSFGLYGCSMGQYIQPKEITYEQLSTCYNQTKLRTTSSLDVLEMIHKPQYELEQDTAELLSQSDTAVSSLGQSKNGYKTWFTMVVFNEQNMTAERKYFYLIDEKAKTSLTKLERFLTPSKKGLIFDGQVVLPAEVLDKSYITEEAKQIAILKQVADDLHGDIDKLSKVAKELSQGSQKLGVCGMLMNQVFKTILLELDKSPALSKNLNDKDGVPFDHINLGKGRIRMSIEGSIITVKIKLGYFWNKFETDEKTVTTAVTSKQNI